MLILDSWFIYRFLNCLLYIYSVEWIKNRIIISVLVRRLNDAIVADFKLPTQQSCKWTAMAAGDPVEIRTGRFLNHKKER